jgi:CheY-like chemotaxis protein
MRSADKGVWSKRILFVESDEFVRDSVKCFFATYGCDLVTATTTKEALVFLEKNKFDIIIVEHKTGEMDSIVFFSEIRNSHIKAKKVLIMERNNNKAVLQALSLGVHAHMIAPFSASDLESCLLNLYSG